MLLTEMANKKRPSLLIREVYNMAKFIDKIMKGLKMGKNKGSNKSSDSVSGSLPAGGDVFRDGLDILEGGKHTEETEASTEKEDIEEEELEEPEVVEIRAERTHEKVSRIAAEKNTKGYGL